MLPLPGADPATWNTTPETPSPAARACGRADAETTDVVAAAVVAPRPLPGTDCTHSGVPGTWAAGPDAWPGPAARSTTLADAADGHRVRVARNGLLAWFAAATCRDFTGVSTLTGTPAEGPAAAAETWPTASL